MKKTHITLITGLLAMGSASAFAASNTDLTITGTIIPSACELNLSGGGVADLGKVSSKDLNQTGLTQLQTVRLNMAVTCNGALLFALKPVDNRAGSSNDARYFGLGLVNTTQKLGHYWLRPKNILADTVAAGPLSSTNEGTSWVYDSYWKADGWWGVGAMGSAVLLPTQELLVDLDVETFINRADGLDLTNETPIDGNATIEVKYL